MKKYALLGFLWQPIYTQRHPYHSFLNRQLSIKSLAVFSKVRTEASFYLKLQSSSISGTHTQTRNTAAIFWRKESSSQTGNDQMASTSADQMVKQMAEWGRHHCSHSYSLMVPVISLPVLTPPSDLAMCEAVLAFGSVSAGKVNSLATVWDRATETKKSWHSLPLAMQLVSECWGLHPGTHSGW